MFMFRIWHGNSFSLSIAAVTLGGRRSSGIAIRDLDYSNGRHWQFFRTLAGALIQVFPASWTEPQTVVIAERLHWSRQDDVFTQHRGQFQLIALILILIVRFLFLLGLYIFCICFSGIDSLRVTWRRLGFWNERGPHREGQGIFILF